MTHKIQIYENNFKNLYNNFIIYFIFSVFNKYAPIKKSELQYLCALKNLGNN